MHIEYAQSMDKCFMLIISDLKNFSINNVLRRFL